ALDSMAHQAERTLTEHKDALAGADTQSVQTEIDAAKQLLEDVEASAEALKGQSEKLERALHGISEALYRAQGAKGGDDGAQAKSSRDEGDVVDAEFTEDK